MQFVACALNMLIIVNDDLSDPFIISVNYTPRVINYALKAIHEITDLSLQLLFYYEYSTAANPIKIILRVKFTSKKIHW